jgi:hypothetical protein
MLLKASVNTASVRAEFFLGHTLPTAGRDTCEGHKIYENKNNYKLESSSYTNLMNSTQHTWQKV